jgi:hypothetical protein
MNFALGKYNLLSIESPTIAGGSWLADAPVTKIATWALADSARSTDLTTTSTKITIDWGAAKTAQILTFPRHNLSSTATIRWKRGTTAGASDVADSTSLPVWLFTPRAYRGDVYEVIVLQASETSARYETVEIVDTSNPDGYVDIGRVFISPLFVPAVWQSYGARDGYEDISVVKQSKGGADWRDRQRRRRTASFVLDQLTLAEGAALNEMEQEEGLTEEVAYLPYLDDPAEMQRYAFTGLLKELNGIEYPYANTRRRAFSMTKRL